MLFIFQWLRASLAAVSGPIIALLLIWVFSINAISWARGKTIETRNAELATARLQITGLQRSLDELAAVAETRRVQMQASEKEAAAIRAKGRSSVTRAQKVVIVGDCVADMQQLAAEAQK